MPSQQHEASHSYRDRATVPKPSAHEPYLKPRHVLLVVPPRLSFQLARSKVLLKRALLIVEYQEQRIRVELFEHVRLLEGRRGLTWEGRRRPIRTTWHVPVPLRPQRERREVSKYIKRYPCAARVGVQTGQGLRGRVLRATLHNVDIQYDGPAMIAGSYA